MLTYGNLMSFLQFADGLGNSVQALGLLQVLLNLVDLNLQVVQRLLKKSNFRKIRRKIYFLSRLWTWLEFKKHLHRAFGEIF